MQTANKKPRDFTRLTLKLFRKKFYQKPVSFLKKVCENLCNLVVIKRS